LDLLDLLTRHGLALVAGSVLLEQSGLPVPAAPVLVGAGALAQEGAMRPELVLMWAFVACVVADHTWFWLGRWRGRRLLAVICRLSLSPDTCVRRTDDLIGRHGAPLLLVAKFIPGVSAVAIPTAAAMGLPYVRFIVFDSLGCLIWSGAYVGAGMIFSREVSRVFGAMDVIGGWSLVVVLSLLALYIALKAAHRAHLRRLYRLVRIAPEELATLVANEPHLVVVDARSDLAYAMDPRRLPRSLRFGNDDDIPELLPRNARDNTVVTFCTCPNEASAALLADQLIKAGYSRVRVLTGGEDALALLAMQPI
jgi:membrane protein DedA with SNARE-associated domain/rhodanese-related sulfurtransferase